MNFNKLIPSFCLAGLLLSLAGILFAPALASAGTLICALAGLWQWKKLSWKTRKHLLIPPFLLVWLVLVSTFNGWTSDTSRLLLLKLPLLLFPVFAFGLEALNKRHLYLALTAWVWLLYAAAMASLWVYLGDPSWYHQLVLESKPMPVLARMHHIEFSLFLASSVWAGIALWRMPLVKPTLVLLRRFTILAAGLNLILLHLLSARTGLLAFYTGTGIGLFLAFRQHWKSLLLGACALMFMLVLAGMLVPSLRNRLINTSEDLQTVTGKQNPNDKSFAQRWEAWKASVYLIEQHPATGMGMKELAPAMAAAHDSTGSAVLPWNRKMPHNQYLETGVQGGIPAIALLVIWLILLLHRAITRRAFFLLALCCMMLTAFVFESMLEQQSGVLLCTLLLLLAASSDEDQNKQE